MNQPLSWIWVAQVMVLIAAGTAGLLAIMWVTLRGRPTWHHVVTHEVNRGWEEIRAEIEARERDKGLKPQWVYHGTHDRQNGAHAREAEAPGGSSLHDHRPHRDGRQPPAPAWPVGAGAGRLVQALGGLTRVRSRPGDGTQIIAGLPLELGRWRDPEQPQPPPRLPGDRAAVLPEAVHPHRPAALLDLGVTASSAT
jgi:hypothetical protein